MRTLAFPVCALSLVIGLVAFSNTVSATGEPFTVSSVAAISSTQKAWYGDNTQRNKHSVACQLCMPDHSVSVSVNSFASGLIFFNASDDGTVASPNHVRTVLNETVPHAHHVACAKNMIMVYGSSSSSAFNDPEASAYLYFIYVNTSTGIPEPQLKLSRTYTLLGGYGREDNGNWSHASVSAAKHVNSFGFCGQPGNINGGSSKCYTYDFDDDSTLLREQLVLQRDYTHPYFTAIGLTWTGQRAVIVFEGNQNEYYRWNSSGAWNKSPDQFVTASHLVPSSWTTYTASSGLATPALTFNPVANGFMVPGVDTSAGMVLLRTDPTGYLYAAGTQVPLADQDGVLYKGTYFTQMYMLRDPRFLMHVGDAGGGQINAAIYGQRATNLDWDLNEPGGTAYDTELGYVNAFEMCPTMGNGSYVYLTALTNGKIYFASSNIGFAYRPTIDAISSESTLQGAATYVHNTTVVDGMTITYTINGLGSATAARIHFTKAGGVEEVIDATPTTYWVDLTVPNGAATYTVTLNLHDIGAENGEGIEVVTNSTNTYIPEGDYIVQVRVLTHTNSWQKSDNFMVHVESPHFPRATPVGPLDNGFSEFVVSGIVAAIGNTTNVIKMDVQKGTTNDTQWIAIFEKGVGIHMAKSIALGSRIVDSIEFVATTNMTDLVEVVVDQVSDLYFMITENTITAYYIDLTTGDFLRHNSESNGTYDMTVDPAVDQGHNYSCCASSYYDSAVPATMNGGENHTHIIYIGKTLDGTEYIVTASYRHSTGTFSIPLGFTTPGKALMTGTTHSAPVVVMPGTTSVPTLVLVRNNEHDRVDAYKLNYTQAGGSGGDSGYRVSGSIISTTEGRDDFFDLMLHYERQERYFYSEFSQDFNAHQESISGGVRRIITHGFNSKPCGQDGSFSLGCAIDSTDFVAMHHLHSNYLLVAFKHRVEIWMLTGNNAETKEAAWYLWGKWDTVVTHGGSAFQGCECMCNVVVGTTVTRDSSSGFEPRNTIVVHFNGGGLMEITSAMVEKAATVTEPTAPAYVVTPHVIMQCPYVNPFSSDVTDALSDVPASERLFCGKGYKYCKSGVDTVEGTGVAGLGGYSSTSFKPNLDKDQDEQPTQQKIAYKTPTDKMRASSAIQEVALAIRYVTSAARSWNTTHTSTDVSANDKNNVYVLGEDKTIYVYGSTHQKPLDDSDGDSHILIIILCSVLGAVLLTSILLYALSATAPGKRIYARLNKGTTLGA